MSRYLKGYFACRNTCKGPEAGTCLGALRRVSGSMCPEHHDGGGGIQRDGHTVTLPRTSEFKCDKRP